MTASDDAESDPTPHVDSLCQGWSDEYLLTGLVDAIKFQCRVVGGYLRSHHDTVGDDLREAVKDLRSDVYVQVVTDLWRA